MNYSSVITNLYFMLIHADGKVNEREISLGQQLVHHEGLDAEEFNVQMILLKSKDQLKLYGDSVENLKKMDREKQINCIAWLCVVANADGFMDRTEWQFIYKLYHHELQLPLDDVMNKQKELNRIQRPAVFSSSSQSQAVFAR
jgi:uncharacterized tellurite resistance protein B-like protein